jgi:hypothetical protein
VRIPWINRSRKERSAFSPPGSRHRIADYFRPDSRSKRIEEEYRRDIFVN